MPIQKSVKINHSPQAVDEFCHQLTTDFHNSRKNPPERETYTREPPGIGTILGLMNENVNYVTYNILFSICAHYLFYSVCPAEKFKRGRPWGAIMSLKLLRAFSARKQ